MADVLTDAELKCAFGRGEIEGGVGPYGLRAVERAVLAKLSADVERKVRGREREAFHRGAAWGDFRVRGGPCAVRDIDAWYPLPTRPRAITLSSGEVVTAKEYCRDVDMVRPPGPIVRLNATSVLTAADIAALAELVKNPTEPCE